MESLHLSHQQVPEPSLHTRDRPGIVQSSYKPWLGVRGKELGLGVTGLETNARPLARGELNSVRASGSSDLTSPAGELIFFIFFLFLFLFFYFFYFF